MFFSIVRDAVTLFLLLYAIIDVANKIAAFLCHILAPKKCSCIAISVLPLSECSCHNAEYHIRTLLKQSRNILLIEDGCDAETAIIAKKLSCEYEYVRLVSFSECLELLTPQRMINIYEASDKAANLSTNK